MDNCGGYQSFDFVADFYDHIEVYKNRTDVQFFIDEAVKTGGPVLELGCGTGRVLIPTAREGIDIVGFDFSDHMLNKCREYLAKEPEEVRERVTLLQGDMREFNLGRKFNLITLPFRPFQHLTTVDDQIKCLDCIYEHLNNDGILILDLFNPSIPFLGDEAALKETGEEPEITLPDGRRMKRRFKIVSRDFFSQVSQIEIIYYVTHPSGKTERLVHEFPMRYIFRWETEHLLARCGYEILELFADYDRSEYGSKYPGELIFVAKKEIV